MENLISRYRNVTILAALLFVQVLGLAVQVKRSNENEPTRLIRIWAVSAVTPFERTIVFLQNGTGNIWHNYFYLRGVRQENRDLKQKIQQLEIERARLSEDAEQAHRLQALLGFKEEFISQTVAAQVIGSSGSEQSRSVYIDKGRLDGVRADMAVITADGIIGKVLRVEKGHVASVLLINDQTSGVGAILEKTRLQGVLRGTPGGEVVLEKVMSDETVPAGERVLTSGGDQIFPKGLIVGTVTKVSLGQDLFLNIRVKPAADLSRLEEVLVITQQQEREPAVTDATPTRAADILAERLPSVPVKPPTEAPKSAAAPAGGTSTPNPNASKTTAASSPGRAASPKTTGTTAKAGNESATTVPSAANPGTPKAASLPSQNAPKKPASTGTTKAQPASAKPQVPPASEPSPDATKPQDQPQ